MLVFSVLFNDPFCMFLVTQKLFSSIRGLMVKLRARKGLCIVNVCSHKERRLTAYSNAMVCIYLGWEIINMMGSYQQLFNLLICPQTFLKRMRIEWRNKWIIVNVLVTVSKEMYFRLFSRLPKYHLKQFIAI